MSRLMTPPGPSTARGEAALLDAFGQDGRAAGAARAGLVRGRTFMGVPSGGVLGRRSIPSVLPPVGETSAVLDPR